MPDFFYADPFPLKEDTTEYKLLTKDFVSTVPFGDKEILKVEPEGLTFLAEKAMEDVSFYLRTAHLEKVRKILDDPEATPNDRFVAMALLKNAVIAADKQLPSCQDTGTGIVMAKKGEYVITGGDDAEALSRGIYNTYVNRNLRYSQVVPLTMYEEVNSGSNLPAQIDIYSTPGDKYSFLFLAKGGGSANKTYLFQETKALLNPTSLEKFIADKVSNLGTAACPPYHIAVVIGGTSAEANLKTVKLASAGYLDHLPTKGDKFGSAFRDIELEEKMLAAAQKSGIGAQFGGKYLAHDFKVIRLPRHGASCPVGLGVSCSADRNIKAKITKDGIYLEKLEYDPAKFLPTIDEVDSSTESVHIDLNQPMPEILKVLSKYPVKTRVMLSGRLVVARDIAHAKLKEKLDKGEPLPEYFKNHPVYYAGPAKTPEGMPSGSFGPTTAGRMDSYVPVFQEKGFSMITLAKGNRSKVVTDSCKKNGGFYLGSIGGPAALLAKENIKKVEVLDFPELGMEAVWSIDVENFPAFIVVDDKGNDFFQMLN
ncbi:fumarate hydratase [Leptospira levettii]|uniref:Fumarate hydratase class I n=1 Tax=Leptospira levettii TaxID=2023178 RepID=A0ABY2MPS5_9LEPT|nr:MULTISPECIES: fumarate hydratase [Leptospira]PKA27140.1 fumarate hydratase [Leptospira sp. mixed culture ATI2-C-A1]MBL0955077.1 fumarate hydratase [Leptospira sp.]MCG6146940.1 fumarate hydratase [Leptospira levettii]MCW7474605.1 fumarate hydratase [Leptospira levettii]MCW7507019.1 fumarate hydratase [Leptospira levettii]